MEDKAAEAPKPPEAEQKPSPHELVILKKRQRMVQAAAAVVLLVLIAAVALFLMSLPPAPAATTTTTSSSSTTSTTSSTSTSTTSSTTTSTSTTLPPASSGDIKVVAYQFKAPYVPEKNFLEEEWVVLKNAGNVSVNLTDWKIKNRNYKNTFTIPEFVLAPGAAVKIHTGSGFDTESDIYMGYTEEFWNNEIDTITVFDRDWNIVAFWKGLGRTQHPGE